MTITLQAPSLVEKTEPVQVRFTLHWRDRHSKYAWIPAWHQMDHVSWSLGLSSKTTSWNTKAGDHGTPNTHNRWFTLCHHQEGGPKWIKMYWNSIWLRTRSHMTSHYTWGSATTPRDFGGELGRWPLDTLCWALTISWSRLLAHVWSGPT